MQFASTRDSGILVDSLSSTHTIHFAITSDFHFRQLIKFRLLVDL